MFKINCGCGHLSTTLADAVMHVEKTGHQMDGGVIKVTPIEPIHHYPYKVLLSARRFFASHGYETKTDL